MFTGIIETLGKIEQVRREGSNIRLQVRSTLASALRVDQSVAHNGICLTVEEIEDELYQVSAVEETIQKTTVGSWQAGELINLERSLKIGDRLDGHFVQGHVDATGSCTEIKKIKGSHLFRFAYPASFAALLVEKGSICINGVSLTAFDVTPDAFSVAIIPFTFAHTNFSSLKNGQSVNLEFDILGKYLLRQQQLSK